MNKLITLVFFLIVIMGYSAFAEDLSGSKLTWYNLKEGLEKASTENKPILVNFIDSLKKSKNRINTKPKAKPPKRHELTEPFEEQSCAEVKKSLFDMQAPYVNKLDDKFILVKLDLSGKLTPQEETFRDKFSAAIGKVIYGRNTESPDTYTIHKRERLRLVKAGGDIDIITTEEKDLKVGTKSVTVSAMAEIEDDGLVIGKILEQHDVIIGTEFTEIASPFINKPYVDSCKIVFLDHKGEVIRFVKENKRVIKNVMFVDPPYSNNGFFFEENFLDYVLKKK